MKRITAIILVLMIAMGLSSVAYAADYNFASAQASKTITVVPGKEGTGTIYFYNISGDRITHVTLEVGQAPDNWQVEIQPPLGETKVEIGGNIVTVTENLYVEPSEVLTEKPDTSPEGTVYIPIPDQGFALAKIATITVSVPASEAPGTQQEIVIAGVARWLGQTGAAAISQARDFTFTVNVVPETTNGEERIITETETEPGETQEISETATTTEATQEATTAAETTASDTTTTTQASTGDDESQSTLGKWLPVIIAVVIVILGAILIPVLIRRRHGQ